MNRPSTFFFIGVTGWIVLSFCFSLCTYSQDLKFFHYGYEHGISSESVGDIFQDQSGFIWLATSHGINRFDGRRFKAFTYQAGEENTLSANSISTIFESPEGKLWIGTRGGGVNVYDPQTDQFHHIMHDPNDSLSLSNNYVNQISADFDGHIWIATDDGLNELVSDPRTPEQAKFRLLADLPHSFISSFAEWPKGTLWLGTDKRGLYKYDRLQQSYTHYRFSRKDISNSPIPFNIIQSLYVDTLWNHQGLWIATMGGVGKVTLAETGEFQFEKYRTNLSDSTSLPHYRITQIVRDGPQSLWFTSRKGLIRTQESTNGLTFKHYLHTDTKPNGLISNEINNAFVDGQGNLWLGTEKGLDMSPILVANQNALAFHHQQLPFTGKVNPIKDVGPIYEDKWGNVWIGTFGHGLLLRHKASGQDFYFNHHTSDITNELVTTISQDQDGIFSIGTFGGFNRMTYKDSAGLPVVTITPYTHEKGDSTSLSDNHIFAVYDDERGSIWIGTRGGGLNRFDKEKKIFEHFIHSPDDPNSISNNYIWSICQDENQNLWLATDKGLNRLDLASQTFRAFIHEPTNPHSLAEDFLNMVFIDTKNRLWVGTNGSGISIMEDLNKAGTFSHIRQADGLSHDQVLGIMEDVNGDFWVSTYSGLNRMTHDNLNFHLQTYDPLDGLQGTEFNTNSFFISPQGKLYVGGSNGYNAFFPDSIRHNKTPPKVVIAEISCNNHPISPGQLSPTGQMYISHSTPFASHLQLGHRDLVVDIEFAALNYLFSEKNQYAFRLKGFNDEWIYRSGDPSFSFTKLPAGEYTFEVKAANNDGVWNETPTKLQISVAPPPWRSMWAYTLYFMAISTLIFGGFRFRIQQKEKELHNQMRVEQARIQERETVLKNASADYHDELGNKMTKISLFVELAKRQGGLQEIVMNYLQQIETNAQQLSEGMRDFIWMLDPEKDTLFDLVSRLNEFAEPIFTYTSTQFKIKGLTPDLASVHLPLSYRRHLILIFKEALNNAVKYADANLIQFEILKKEEEIHIYIRDDGKGFDPEARRKGYGLENMKDRAQKIDAQFAIKAQIHQGTEIHLNISLPQMEDRESKRELRN